MTRYGLLHLIAICLVGISAVVGLVWALAPHPETGHAEWRCGIGTGIGNCNIPGVADEPPPVAPEIPVRKAQPPDDPEVSWERDHFSIAVTVDPMLTPPFEPLQAQPQRPGSPDYWDTDRGRLRRISRLDTGELQLRVGDTDGFGGGVIEIRLHKEESGALRAEAMGYVHRDAGPPFEIAFSSMTGGVRLSSDHLASGDTFLIVCSLGGSRTVQDTMQSYTLSETWLRVTVP